ncbi:hypothetical protein WICMUC_005100 [Wickerhamomyces mucosus]|uniref:Endoplasmic reticulum resident protein 29 C-terminal domain-containing protein n=1 Tax=Wickerhamomyces mucosus TaxID=1378264 RepID=A0A9P8PBW4_9ASCO|nr:hypothetical protein WICMUC_005100 [Wickerhamomyces mucosus]
MRSNNGVYNDVIHDNFDENILEWVIAFTQNPANVRNDPYYKKLIDEIKSQRSTEFYVTIVDIVLNENYKIYISKEFERLENPAKNDTLSARQLDDVERKLNILINYFT